MHKEIFTHLGQANTRENIVASVPYGRADFSFASPEPMKNWGGNAQDPSQFKNPWNENNQHSNLSQAYYHNYLACNSTSFYFIENFRALQVSN